MRIGIITSGNVTVDPRYAYLASSFKKEGWEVIFLNIRIFDNLKKEKKQQINRKHTVLDIDLTDEFSKRKSFLGFLAKSYFFCSSIYSHLSTETKVVVEGLDVLWGAEPFWGAVMAQGLADAAGKILIVDCKELISESITGYFQKRIARIIECKLFKKSILLPCVSQKIIDFYKQRYRNKIPDISRKLLLVENSMPFMNLIPDFSVSEKKINMIVSAGSLGRDRGGEALAHIWEALDPVNARLDLRIACMPEKEKNKLRIIAKNTFGKSLFVMDPVDEDEMVKMMAEYDCGIIPYLPNASLNNRYCCPNKLGQYANAGLAVISSNTEYITERIVTFDLGIIYDPQEIDESVAIFHDYIGNISKINQNKINAYAFAKNNYFWENSVFPLLEKLHTLKLQLKAQNGSMQEPSCIRNPKSVPSQKA